VFLLLPLLLLLPSSLVTSRRTHARARARGCAWHSRSSACHWAALACWPRLWLLLVVLHLLILLLLHVIDPISVRLPAARRATLALGSSRAWPRPRRSCLRTKAATLLGWCVVFCTGRKGTNTMNKHTVICSSAALITTQNPHSTRARTAGVEGHKRRQRRRHRERAQSDAVRVGRARRVRRRCACACACMRVCLCWCVCFVSNVPRSECCIMALYETHARKNGSLLPSLSHKSTRAAAPSRPLAHSSTSSPSTVSAASAAAAAGQPFLCVVGKERERGDETTTARRSSVCSDNSSSECSAARQPAPRHNPQRANLSCIAPIAI
jgi:hypothetical protein